MKGTDIDVILHNVHCKNGKDEGQSRATCVDHIIIQCNNVQYELRHNKKVYIGGIEQPLPFEGSEKGCSFGEDETHVTIECKGTLTGKWNGVQIVLADDSDDNTEGMYTDGHIKCVLFEPRREKTCLWGFRPGLTQTGLHSHRRWLEA